jgi:hypothetical protein
MIQSSRFTDSGTILRRVPSDESLGYFHTVRFADSGINDPILRTIQPYFAKPQTPMLSSPSLKTFQFLSVEASH